MKNQKVPKVRSFVQVQWIYASATGETRRYFAIEKVFFCCRTFLKTRPLYRQSQLLTQIKRYTNSHLKVLDNFRETRLFLRTMWRIVLQDDM